jgi:hypothetical protein
LNVFRNNMNRCLHDDYTQFIYSEFLKLRRSQGLSDKDLLTVLIPYLRRRKS